jgi:beta-phosphoglucomutase-like phosphatase (HAD superfamily)
MQELTMLTLPEGPFDAYIFDCDGTLIDSMPLHLEAWRAALASHGFDPAAFTLEMHHRYAGMPGVAIVSDLNDRFGTALDPAAVEADKVAWYLAHHSDVRAIEPVVAVARAARGRLPMAVASGSDAGIVVDSLRAVGILEWFATVITPADVARGKPAPDMFLLAAERMGVAPERCLVFEDGHLGIAAAEAAGMATVFIPADAFAGHDGA